MTACAWSVVTAVAIALQQAPVPEPPRPDPAAGSSLARIREGLRHPPVLEIPDLTDQVRFRVTVEGLRPLLVSPAWDPAGVVPDYVRSARPLYHHEFLQMVTPEEFRAGALYPGMSVSGIAQALVGGIREDIRRARQEAIRRQVKEELRRFLEEQKKREERP
ncbi:MAG TPA: hypothetical protein VK886_16520 [Vicinamibacterales bacterium]|nr:hypothetical protein [Vicinamibacterales bacterium]